ncbi:MAG: class I SAM-dependent methyltransferase [Sedimentisphaerales bacterium]|jgi:ubiquinone/menaquinone biosynthesis C-methylase UbiE
MRDDESKFMAGDKKLAEAIVDETVSYFDYLKLPYKNREDVEAILINDEKTKTDLVEFFDKEIFPLKNKRILDVGCGKGGVVVACALKGAEAAGFDVDEREIDIAKRRAESYNLGNVSISHGDGEKIPFKDNYFDLVMAMSVLEHVKDLEGVIKEMVRVTKPGGYCYVTVPNPIFPREAHYKVFYIPYMPKYFGKIYLKMRGFNPDFFDKYVTYPYPSVSKLSNIFENSGTSVRNLTEENILLRVNKLKSTRISECKNTKERLLKIPVIGRLIAVAVLLFNAYPSVCFLAKKDIGCL